MTTKLRVILLLVFMLSHYAVYAVPNAGSCADTNFKFPIQDPPPEDLSIIDTTIPVRVLKEGALLYDSATGSTSTRSLKFDERFKPLKQQGQRIQVGKLNTTSPEGWVEKHDLLCNHIPLNEKGLPRKAFVKIPTASAENYFIPSYPSPEEPIYGDESKILNKISAFKNHFVFAEDIEQKRFLLSTAYNIASTEFIPLTGWVDIEHIIQWKTNLGIRPQEDAGHISGYLTLEDSGKSLDDKTEGVELTGGKIWYTFSLHMPLLDTVNKGTQEHYKVAASGAGMVGFMPSRGTGTEKYNKADLFFLLDGTASMEPYIKSAQQAIEKIVHILENPFSNHNDECELEESDLREVSLRCGFLIYRDHYADARKYVNCKNGLCEYQALSQETCNTSDSSCGKVIEALSKVKATADDNDDYEELLFDGLTRSTSLMASCPGNSKLLVVIGDHGNKQDELPQTIVSTLDEKLGVFPYFIQTDSNQSNVRNSDKYITAYSKFADQSLEILTQMKKQMEERGQTISEENIAKMINPQDFIVSPLSAKETPCEIVKSFFKYHVNPSTMNKLDEMLYNGDSVTAAINRLRASDEMSALFWARVGEKVCKNMPEQCEKPLKHRVNEFFVPIDKEKFVEELLLVEFHIQNWRELFKPLINLNLQLSAQDKRKRLQELTTTGVQRVLGDPPIEDTDERALEEIIAERKLALPVRPQSPLLQYSPYDFNPNNKDMIVDCEVNRILEWIRGIDRVLERIVSSPTQKVIVDFVEYGETDCPLSDKGKRIKKIKFKEEWERLGPDDSYRYGHVISNVMLYWIPLEYLP